MSGVTQSQQLKWLIWKLSVKELSRDRLQQKEGSFHGGCNMTHGLFSDLKATVGTWASPYLWRRAVETIRGMLSCQKLSPNLGWHCCGMPLGKNCDCLFLMVMIALLLCHTQERGREVSDNNLFYQQFSQK